MRDITVTFTLKDEHEQRLRKIAEEYKIQHNFETTEERLFETIMTLGGFQTIDEKLKFHEWKLGLREDYK